MLSIQLLGKCLALCASGRDHADMNAVRLYRPTNLEVCIIATENGPLSH